MYITKRYSKDTNRFFSADKKSGILIQSKLHRAIYYVNNISKDTYLFSPDTPLSELENWILAKQKHFESIKETVEQ